MVRSHSVMVWSYLGKVSNKKTKKSREFSLTPRPPPPGGVSREFIIDFLPIPNGQICVVLR